MNYNKKTSRWVEAGLLSADQAQAICSFERSRKTGSFTKKIVGLSLFIILVGVVSIISANWYLVPGDVKIVIHLLVNAAIGAGAFITCRKQSPLWQEVFTTAFFALTMTLIILIGQVYQLDGDAPGATLLWFLLTLPFMALFSQGYISGWSWVIALLITVALNFVKYVEEFPDSFQALSIISLVALFPMALVGIGRMQLMQQWKPVWAKLFSLVGFVLLIGGASSSILLFSQDFIADDFLRNGPVGYFQEHSFSVGAVGISALLLHGLIHRWYVDAPDPSTQKVGGLFVWISFLLIILSFMQGVISFPLLDDAPVFLAYWGFIMWSSQKVGMVDMARIASLVMGLRVFLLYVSLSHGLLSFGATLVSSGIVMLLLVMAIRWVYKNILTKSAKEEAPAQ